MSDPIYFGAAYYPEAWPESERPYDIKMMKEVVICYDWDFGHSGMVLNDEDAVKLRDLFRNYMMKKTPFKGDDCVLHLPLFMVKDEEMLTYIEALRNNHKM